MFYLSMNLSFRCLFYSFIFFYVSRHGYVTSHRMSHQFSVDSGGYLTSSMTASRLGPEVINRTSSCHQSLFHYSTLPHRRCGGSEALRLHSSPRLGPRHASAVGRLAEGSRGESSIAAGCHDTLGALPAHRSGPDCRAGMGGPGSMEAS